MTNKPMLSVEREFLERLLRVGLNAVGIGCKTPAEELRAILDKPAAQHQGEPVAIPRISGIGRDADHPKALILYLGKVPDDYDIRAIQNALRQPSEQPAPVAVQISWSDVEPWYLANEQRLSDIRKFEGSKGFALEVWRGARLNGVKP